MIALAALLIAAAQPAPPAPSAPPVGTLTVLVTGVRSDAGRVQVELCPRELFTKDCPMTQTAPARRGTTTVVFRNVPAGRWAAQGFHDANGNGRIDTGLLGIPKEGYGFSRDAPATTSAPKWSAASFDLAGPGDQTISFRLHYW
ncbi:MAG: DUF2141 domain-containing protein [Sphingomonadaceae bacterium]|nr:DUF2141 domain-containing protein [Sphingomonadaceae bacterium]